LGAAVTIGSERGSKIAVIAARGCPVEAIMAEPSAEPIPPDFAEAFAYAVLVYEIWTPEEPGRLIKIGSRSYSIVEVCRFVDQFTDRLPERVYLKLRSYMHDYPDGKLKAELAADPSYATAVRCLRGMIERRTEDYKQRGGMAG
jgi:hypothetical protein